MPNKQPDLEIYILNPDTHALGDWLADCLPEVTLVHEKPSSILWKTPDTEILFSLKVEKNFSSLWVKTNATAWDADLDLARDAYKALGVEIRCSAGGWQETEGEHSDESWIKINARGEKPFSW